MASLPHGDQRKLEVVLLMALERRSACSTNLTAGMSHDEAPGDPEPDPRTEEGQDQDHPAGGAQRWTWCASWPTASSC